MFGWIVLLMGLGVAAASVGIVLVRTRRANPDKEFEVFWCPACEQKIRYSASKAGQIARCPRCKKYVNLPKASERTFEYSPHSRNRVRVGQVVRRNSWYRGQVISQS